MRTAPKAESEGRTTFERPLEAARDFSKKSAFDLFD